MSVVAASISRSSADRSEKPGRACFACSLSRAVTGSEAREGIALDLRGVEWTPIGRHTFSLGTRENLFYLVGNIDPVVSDIR